MMQTTAHYIDINHPTILVLNRNHGYLGTWVPGYLHRAEQQTRPDVLTEASLLPEGSVVN